MEHSTDEQTDNEQTADWVIQDAPATTVTYVSLFHKYDATCLPSNERVVSWGAFARRVLKEDGHELRGAPGQDVAADDSYKSGLNGWALGDKFYEGTDAERHKQRIADMREWEAESYACCLPVRMAWGRPVGGDAPSDADRRFISQHGKQTPLRRREKHAVAGSDAVVVLDLDDVEPDEYAALCDRLDELYLDAVIVSSYNHGAKLDASGKPSIYKLRLFVRATCGYAAKDIRAVRLGLASLLGVRADHACLSPVSLFFWPATRPDRAQHAILENFEGGSAVDTEACRARGVEVDPRTGGAPEAIEWTGEVASKDQRAAASEQLEGLCNTIRYFTPGPALRPYTEQATFKFGGYCAAGALDLENTRAQLHAAMTECWRERLHETDKYSLDFRLNQIDTGLREGSSRPSLPLAVPDAEDDAADDYVHPEHNLCDLEDRLRDRAKDETAEVSLDKARAAMTEGFDAFMRAPNERHVWVVTTGGGKTFGVEQGVASADDEARFVYSTRGHALLSQTAREAQDLGIPTQYLRGVTALESKTGVPGCPRLEWEAARKDDGKRHLAVMPVGLSVEDAEHALTGLAQRGVSFLSSVCPSCSLREECPARAHAQQRIDADVKLVVTPPELVDRALEQGRLLILDEEPPREQQETLTPEQLALLDGGRGLPLHPDQSEVIFAIAAALHADAYADK